MSPSRGGLVGLKTEIYCYDNYSQDGVITTLTIAPLTKKKGSSDQ